MRLWDRNDTDAQHFSLLARGDGTYDIVHVSSGLRLYVRDSSTDNGAIVQLYTQNDGFAQHWHEIALGHGYNAISNPASG